ncbi:calcium-binding protein [Shimia sp. SDUM112013]|uniref:calcium-binding protein n=1 Tax=Shimia sp. SDUM112013 TaxID=3136160 RepID=UPI0032ED703B
MPDLPRDFTSPARVAIGTPYSGTFEVRSGAIDSDAIGFEAEAGVTYRLRVNAGTFDQSRNPLFRENWDRDGLIDRQNPFGPEADQVLYATSDSTGTVFVNVESYGLGNGDHPYTVTIQEVQGDPSPFATNAQPLAIGQTLNLRNDFYFDEEMFAVTLVGGQRYEFQATEVGVSVFNEIRLFRESGDGAGLEWIVGETPFQTAHDRMLLVTPPEDGEYFLRLQGGSSPGAYTLTSRESDDLSGGPDTSASITVGNSQTGWFDGASDTDAYAIDLLAGVPYDFELISDFGMLLHLLGPDGELMVRGDTSLTTSVNSDGTYYIAPQARYGFANSNFGPIEGAFTLTASFGADIPGNTQTEEQLTIGTPLTEELFPNDTDWFGMSLAADTSYRLSYSRSESRETRLSLNDASGQPLIASMGEPARPIYFASGEGGNFFAGIQSLDRQGGTYTLRIDPVTDIGQSVATAAEMPLNTERRSHLFHQDEDWFSVTPEGDSLIMVEYNRAHGAKPELRIGGGRLDLDGQSYGGIAATVVSEADPFILEVSDRAGNAANFYTLHVAQLRDAGTDGREALVGTDGNDTLSALANNDTLLGGDGNDSLFAGRGEDLLFGGQGDDGLFGGLGHDRLNGDRGNDLLAGHAGDDNLVGGHGNDTLVGGAGDDFLNGGYAPDILYGGDGADQFYHAARMRDSSDWSHGTDWIADYSDMEGDVLVFRSGAVRDVLFDLQDLGAGDANTDELVISVRTNLGDIRDAFVLVDGAGLNQLFYNLGDGVDTLGDGVDTLNIFLTV